MQAFFFCLNIFLYYRFPRDPKYKEIWIDATGQKNWFPNQYSRICSIHFKEDSFTETKKFRRLARTAIPTIDVLKTLTNSESIDQYTSNRPSLRNTRKRKYKKVIPSTSSRHPSLLSPKKRKLMHTMNPAQQGNKQNKIFSLASLLKCLTKKSFIIYEQANLLSNINVTINELYSRKSRNEDLDNTADYSPEFRKFALTLHFYSSKGYNYLREVFNLSLPHPRTVEKWYISVDGKPGFTSESLKALKMRADNSKNPIYCCLMIGEMAIQKRVEYDGENTYGWEEFGANLDTDEAPEAREGLVFLVTGINANWTVPVGYFLVERTTSEQKANLVAQCLKNLHESNIIVCGLSCDGYIPNLAMAKTLGCKIEPNEQMNTTFEHPITKQPIAVFLNPCHMMKLVKMCLQSYGNIVDGNGQYVSWAHYELLNKLQNHGIDFDNKKKIATILDKSHAKSLGFCGENLKSQDFKEPSATVEFMRTLNDLFDILTSRNFKQFGFKQPLNLDNKPRIMDFFEKAEDYITKKIPKGAYCLRSQEKQDSLVC